ncbi:MAG: hypothetical protein E4G96_10195 [Chrysiogenales bacterium]|nr:MAG: hypothetical protein E4G96_10195 [Chrysiogenales bacterium]
MTLIIAVILTSAAYFFLFSASGFLERRNLEQSKKKIIANNNALERENARLKSMVDNYRSGVYPADDLLRSGYVKPGDKVLFLGNDDRTVNESKGNSTPIVRKLSLEHIRIGWIVISLVTLAVILIYGWKTRRQEAE